MAQAQVLSAKRLWPALISQVDQLLAQTLPEPQWAVDALLLRADARQQLGQRAAATSDARLALSEARRLQDGAPASRRTQAAQALAARIER